MTTLLVLSERIGHPVLGIVIPAIVLIISFWIAWALFRKFTKEH
jgi:hypothetical protein